MWPSVRDCPPISCSYSTAVIPSMPTASSLRGRWHASFSHSISISYANEVNTICGHCFANTAIGRVTVMIRNTRPYLCCRHMRFVSHYQATRMAVLTNLAGTTGLCINKKFGQMLRLHGVVEWRRLESQCRIWLVDLSSTARLNEC